MAEALASMQMNDEFSTVVVGLDVSERPPVCFSTEDSEALAG